VGGRGSGRKDICLVWPRNCTICTRPFIARHPNASTCGSACSKQKHNSSDDYHRHKARVRRSAEKRSDITVEQDKAMYRRARKCPLCKTWMTGKPGKPNSKELDHIVPICMGGTHTHGNVRIICKLCNLKRPKDGSDYAGPVTLWAQVPDALMPPPPKIIVAKPKPAPKPARMAACADCSVQFAQRSYKQSRCAKCMASLGRRAVELRTQGVPWKEIAPAIGYTVAGAHLLAQRHGLYESALCPLCHSLSGMALITRYRLKLLPWYQIGLFFEDYRCPGPKKRPEWPWIAAMAVARRSLPRRCRSSSCRSARPPGAWRRSERGRRCGMTLWPRP
jgi:hypothetical protein